MQYASRLQNQGIYVHRCHVDKTWYCSYLVPSRFQACPSGLQGGARCNCSISCQPASLSLTPAVAGYNRPTSTRAAFHRPTHGWATGASQPLDHGSGTVCQPGSENFVGSRFCLIDTAAHSDYCSHAPVKYSHSLTHSLTFITSLCEFELVWGVVTV